MRSAGVVAVLRLSSLALTMLVAVLLARALEPAEYGKYAFVVSLITVLVVPFGPSMTQLVLRETAKLDLSNDKGSLEYLGKWANRNALVGTLVTVLVVFWIVSLLDIGEDNDLKTLIIIGTCALPFLAMSGVRIGMLTGLKHVVLAQVPELLVRPLILFLLVLFFFWINELTTKISIYSFILAAVIGFLVGYFLLRMKLPQGVARKVDHKISTRALYKSWIPFLLIALCGTLNSQIGIILLGWLSTFEEVSAMQIAERCSIVVALSLTIVNMVIAPHCVRLYQANDIKGLERLLHKSAIGALFVSLIIASPILLFPDLVIALLFGVDYQAVARDPLIVVTLAQLFNVAMGSVGMVLAMADLERLTLVGQLIALIINLIFAIILIPIYGALGAAIATAVGLVLWNMLLAYNLWRRLSVVPFFMNHLRKGRIGG